MTTVERARLIAGYCQEQKTEQYLGYFAALDLMHWIKHELGSEEILDSFQPISENLKSKATANSPILHILSGNSPHAALQSLMRGILVGAENWIKFPSSGLDVVEKWIENLPHDLKKLITVIEPSKTKEALEEAKTIIAIGSDESMENIHAMTKPHQRFIPHGHKLSISLIHKPSIEAAKQIVGDCCAFNQQGCLSTHTVYLKNKARDFLPLIADAMQHYEEANPRGTISLSESGAITNLRETIRYEAANTPHDFDLLHSKGNTHWTAIYRNSPTLIPSPLNRVISVQPWPDDFKLLGSESHYLSTLSIENEPSLLSEVNNLDIPRICLIGKTQQPSLFWHHDGLAPLGSLVRWRDLEL